MWIVVDIDGTICGVNAGQIFGAFHCQDLGLTIAPEMFATVASYADLVQLPPVRAFWRDHQEEWAASRRRAVLAPAVLAALAPLPGAVEGLRQLTTIGSLCYLSARSPQVHAVTLAWLERHGFPQYDRLCCVDSIREKIQFLARSCPPSEPCVVIDDRGHTSFTQVWLQLVQECPEQIADLGERLTVVAFGCSPQALPTVPYRIMALPRWEPALVQALLTLLGDGEPEGGDHRHA